jgi:hypothetical protein
VKKLLSLAGSLSVIAALIVPAQQAEAAPPGSAFDPGLIITGIVASPNAERIQMVRNA